LDTAQVKRGKQVSSQVDRWGIVHLYVEALRKAAWIEAVSLGYTLLEMELQYLARSKARMSGQPLPEDRIEKCRYLMDVAVLTRDEGFLPQPIFDRVKAFNDARIRIVHKLLTETVTLAEIEDAAKSISPISQEIQALWLTITFGPTERAV
jgi:hypothetical protein